MSTINKYTVNKYYSSLVTWCHMCHVTVTVINGKVDQIRNSILTDSNYTRPWSPGRRLKKIDLNQDPYLPNQKAPFSSAQDSVQTCIKIHISIVTSFYYILYTYYIYILRSIFLIYIGLLMLILKILVYIDQITPYKVRSTKLRKT